MMAGDRDRGRVAARKAGGHAPGVGKRFRFVSGLEAALREASGPVLRSVALIFPQMWQTAPFRGQDSGARIARDST